MSTRNNKDYMEERKEFQAIIAKAISKHRNKKGYTLRELEDDYDIGAGYVSGIENRRMSKGKYKSPVLPNSFLLYHIAKALEIPAHEIFPDTTPTPSDERYEHIISRAIENDISPEMLEISLEIMIKQKENFNK